MKSPNSMKVLVGSENPVKIEATREAFSNYFDNLEVKGIKVKSGVPDQPVSNETFEGAENRALELKRLNEEKNLKADFFVGIESGIIKFHSKWFNLGVICILNSEGKAGFGISSGFELPESIVEQLLRGVELGDVTDKLTGEHNSKQKGGAVGFFTKNVMNRKQFYVSGLIIALIPFMNKKLYFSDKS